MRYRELLEAAYGRMLNDALWAAANRWDAMLLTAKPQLADELRRFHQRLLNFKPQDQEDQDIWWVLTKLVDEYEQKLKASP